MLENLLNSIQMSSIILFDGVCNFCNKTVNIIIAHDQEAFFQFAPNQSKAAKAFIARFGLHQNWVNSVVLIEDDKVFTKTDAIIKIAQKLSGWPNNFKYLKLLPKFLRDICYDLIANFRYRLFGKKATCMVPDKSIMDRFI
jgi:predicted DCC family thiol-disulfide oxidoreductase YuxK